MHQQPHQVVQVMRAFVVAAVLMGCGQTAAGPSAAAPASFAPGTAAATAATAESMTTFPSSAAPEPTFLGPTTALPTGYRKAATLPFVIDRAFGDVLVKVNPDVATVEWWDAATFEHVGTAHVGKPGAFPPDAWNAVGGTGGMWVTVASDHAVVLVDLDTGKVKRTVVVPGSPYDVLEADDDLWIVDYESKWVTRYDLEADEVVATISIPNPVDALASDGSIWVPEHLGRHEREEPLSMAGYVARVDPATNAIAETIQVGPRPGTLEAAFGAIWMGSRSGGSVDRLDLATKQVMKIFIGEDGVWDVEAFGGSIWATVGPQWERTWSPDMRFYVRIDPQTNEMLERIAAPCLSWIVPEDNGFWLSGQCDDVPEARDGLSTFFERVP